MDNIDEDILYYLQHNRANAYQVWVALKIEYDGKVLAYVNIWKRLRRLSDNGMIERVQPTGDNLHGGRYYAMSKKGRENIKKRISRLEHILT